MSASLRDNVAFEYETKSTSDERVTQALARSQFGLKDDECHISLETEIGERGVNLSGGQRQRVSLARADFFEAPIVLMDDCLSALDIDTEKKLIEHLICGKWEGRTRILVTHRLEVLKQVDRIFFMEQGRISGIGSWQELLNSSPTFREFTASVAQDSNKAAAKKVSEEDAFPLADPETSDG